MKKRQISKAAVKKPAKIDKKSVNINEKPINISEGLSFIRVLYFGVFLIVLLSAVSLSLFSSNELQFSPPASDSGMSYETASSFLQVMGQQGIDWYCGKTQTYIDKQGTAYGSIELIELKKILQNDDLLRQNFCD